MSIQQKATIAPLPQPAPGPRDSDDRKHQCHKCPLSFKRREHYQRHLRSHTKERPFTCRHCSKSFSRKDLVLRHIRKLHTEGDYLELHGDGSIQSRRYSSNVNEDAGQPSSWVHREEPAGLGVLIPYGSPNATSTFKPHAYVPSRGHTVEDAIDVDSVPGSPTHRARPANNLGARIDSRNKPPLRPLEPRPLVMKGAVASAPSAHTHLRPPAPPVTDPRYEAHFTLEASANRQTGDFVISQQHDYSNASPDLIWDYLKTYFSTMNQHLPLFHVPSFDYAEEPRYLVLVMAAIGAMYQREQQTATALYHAAETEFASNVLSSDAAELTSYIPLADVRTLLLLIIFGAFNGSRQMASRALNRCGRLSACFDIAARTTRHTKDYCHSAELTWEQWIDMEAHKRLLHGIWISYGLVLATYGTAPSLRVYETDIELPSSETMWHAATEEQWLVERDKAGSRRLQTMRDATDLLYPASSDISRDSTVAQSWSPFSVVVVMHVLSVFTAKSSAEEKSAPTINPTISKAQSLLWSLGLSTPSQWTDSRPDFAYNASAALRMASIRPYSNLLTADRTSMLTSVIKLASAAVHHYTREQAPRSQNITEAMAQAFEGLFVPDSGGVLLVRLPPPLTWSPEHLVAAWDTVILLSKWLHTVQLDTPEFYERALMAHIAQTLQRNSWNLGSVLAADLCRFWATFGEEFWIWAISTRMVAVLRSLADIYESTG